MEELKILITTSGVGSRLGDITNYTNKSLVRIGTKPSLSHIIDMYPEDIPIVITLGYYGSHVRDYLTLAYPDRDISFVTVDKYKGPGTSLAYSILQTREELQCPFIFHACDTIIRENVPIYDDCNWLAGSNLENSSQYRTLMVEDGKVIKINEKGSLSFDHSYIGLCKIKDYECFWDELQKLDFSDSSLSDCHVINNMIKNRGCEFDICQTSQWIDIGNSQALKKARKLITSEYDVLDKLDESIFFLGTNVVKFFHDDNICRDRVHRAKNLDGLVPEISDSKDNFYIYPLKEGTLFSKTANRKNFTKFLNWAKEDLWHPTEIDSNEFRGICKKFYFDKTVGRVNRYLELMDHSDDACYINGELVPPALTMIDELDFDWLSDGTPVKFHGDFILDNIIEFDSKFCLIDWRQDFGGSLESGDIYYDLAKLNHNLTLNHDIIKKGMFTVENRGDNISCEIMCSSRLMKCQEIFHKFIVDNNLDLRKVKVLTSLVWINMSPLHEYPFNKFLFNFGKYNLFCNLGD